MPVSDLAKALKMSYMGVKQHCVNLTKMGYLEEWRVPREKKEVGRPEKLYRLTQRSDGLFPESGVALTLAVLDGVKQVFGDTGPEKLLFYHFQRLKDEWLPKVKPGKSMVEKATRFADVRDRAGWFSRCHYDPAVGFRIEEFHSPLAKIYLKYPNAVRMEVEMMEQVLGTKVVRDEVSVGKGGKRVVYEIATLGVRGDDEVVPRAPIIFETEEDEEEQGELF